MLGTAIVKDHERLMLRDREDFVRSKIRQLQEYYIELGKGIQVEYEEEESRPLTKDGNLPLTHVLGIFSLTLAASVFVKKCHI